MRTSFIIALMAGVAALGLLTPAAAAGQTGKSSKDRAKGQIPRTVFDHKPDLSGVWAGAGFTYKEGAKYTAIPEPRNYVFKLPKDIVFQPGGESLWNMKMTGEARHDDPTLVCLPLGFPYITLAGRAQQFIQAPGTLAIVYEDDHTTRVIPTDGRPHPADLEPAWYGDSVGHWEGDTMVIDTVGLKPWISDGPAANHMHTEAAHYIERYRRTGPATMSFEITTDDPKVFSKPWSESWTMHLHPEWRLLEDRCEENNKDPGLIEYLNKNKK